MKTETNQVPQDRDWKLQKIARKLTRRLDSIWQIEADLSVLEQVANLSKDEKELLQEVISIVHNLRCDQRWDTDEVIELVESESEREILKWGLEMRQSSKI